MHKSEIYRTPNAIAGTWGTCGAQGHTRQSCTDPHPRMHENIVVISPHDHPAPQDHYSSVPPPVAWPYQQGGLVMQEGANQWDGGDVGRGAQQWDGGGVGGDAP